MKHKEYSKGIVFILLIGMVSLFADFTYEGGWSIIPQYLTRDLGVSVAVLGMVVGTAEFLGYAIRLFSGFLSSKTKHYWATMFIGYAINLFSVPLLAITGHYLIAIILIALIRLGKGIRVPPRDYVLSEAAKSGDIGKAFAIEEALDQIGAIIGPLTVSLLILYNFNFNSIFALLLIPAILSLTFLTLGYKHYKKSGISAENEISIKGLSKKQVLIYSIAIAISAGGTYNVAFIMYGAQSVTSQFMIPLIFLVAMAGEGAFGFLFGWLYDRFGKKLLYFGLITPIAIPLLILNPIPIMLFLGALFFGITTGIQDTVMRSIVGNLVNKEERAFSFGIFNAFYGFGLLLAGSIIGFLYSLTYIVIIYVIILQMVAAALIWSIFKNK
ncbi:MAG: MFS transporter [Thermoplasmata archaeon]